MRFLDQERNILIFHGKHYPGLSLCDVQQRGQDESWGPLVEVRVVWLIVPHDRHWELVGGATPLAFYESRQPASSKEEGAVLPVSFLFAKGTRA